ncbi:MAG: hypothetical protein Q8L47_00520 [bacterium]|nr:hypothetical protein [bacterium]
MNDEEEHLEKELSRDIEERDLETKAASNESKETSNILVSREDLE